MKQVRRIKLLMDILMYVIFIIMMEYHLLSNVLHEYLGILLLLCFISHIVFNKNWYKALFKGKYTTRRLIQTVVNFLLLFSFAACIISALMISGVVFKNIRIPGMILLGRKIHMVSTAWCFVFMNIHLGLHIPCRSVLKKSCLLRNIVMIVLSANGLYRFFVRRFYEEIFLLTEFKWFDYNKNIIQYFFETVCISFLFVSVTYFIKIPKGEKR